MAAKGLIPQSFIQDLLARVEIAEVVGQYVQLKKAGANFLGLCPFHKENSPSFTVSPAKQFYHCFGCGAHGSALGFLMEYSGLEFVEAVESLASQVGLTVPREAVTPESQQAFEQEKSLTEYMQQAAQFYYQQLKKFRQAQLYFQGRGVSGQIAKQFLLGYAPSGRVSLQAAFPNYEMAELVTAGLVIVNEGRRYDRFRDRVMFPIRNARGQIIAFGGRVLGEGEPKYLNSPETPLFNKSEELYGLYEARQAIRQAGYVLVVEGYMDVVALAQLGFPQVVATLGTAVGVLHVKKLLRYTDCIVFAFDGDKAGQKAAWRALEASVAQATDTRSFKFLFLPSEDDPDSFIRSQGVAAFEDLVQQAWPLSKYMLRHLQEARDLSVAEERAQLLHAAKPLLQQMPSGALRLQLIREFAQLTQVAPAEVEALCGLVQQQSVATTKMTKPRRFASNGTRAVVAGLEQRVLHLLLTYPALGVALSNEAWDVILSEKKPETHVLKRLRGLLQHNPNITFAALTTLLSDDAFCADLLKEIALQDIWSLEAAQLELEGAVLFIQQRQLKEALNELTSDASKLLSAEGRVMYSKLQADSLRVKEEIAKRLYLSQT